jgi:hypothetical protein
MRKSIVIAAVLIFILALAALGVAGKLAPQTSTKESVSKVEATDSQLADLEKLIGNPAKVFPRNFKMAQHDITLIKIKRVRFSQSMMGSGNRSELRFWNLTSVPIEELVGTHQRPYTVAILNGGSIVRYPRAMDAKDVKAVVVVSGNKVRIIELI